MSGTERPRRRAVHAAAPGRRGRRRSILAGLALVVTVLVVLTVAAALDDPATPEAPRAAPGVIYRARFLIVKLGTTRTQTRALLGPPRETRTRDGRDCWVYEPRAGGRGVYEMCFDGNFLRQKTIARE